ncbi:unnamed protein product [Ectocarpus sp. 8 AP-2014]
MAGAVDVQVAREEVFEGFGEHGAAAAGAGAPAQQHQRCGHAGAPPPPAAAAAGADQSAPVVADARSDAAPQGEAHVAVGTGEPGTSSSLEPSSTEAAAVGGVASDQQGEQVGPIVVARHTRLAPYKPGKMTVVLDMDECLLHSKFHGPGAASEAYRQLEERPDAVNEVNSFWVALDDGDTAQVNKRPGLDPFLEALARDYNTIVFTAAMPDYAGPVLDYIDPKGTLFHRRLYRSSCRQVKGAFLKDLSVLGVESTDMSRTVLVDNNPLSFICQPTNGILVASFYDDPNDTALASVMQLIRHLDQAGDVRPILKDMFRLDTLLGEYRTALFDDDDDADVDCILDDDDEEEEDLLEGCLEAGQQERAEAAAAPGGDEKGLLLDVLVAEEEQQQQEGSANGDGQQQLQGEDVECLKDDDDDESVKTEACSEGSGDSSLGDESLTSREEMELELEF